MTPVLICRWFSLNSRSFFVQTEVRLVEVVRDLGVSRKLDQKEAKDKRNTLLGGAEKEERRREDGGRKK